ncbi:MAG: hypothetical protein ACYTG0_39835 [Planctomycetota bacterium]|jgi:hypothetical protein
MKRSHGTCYWLLAAFLGALVIGCGGEAGEQTTEVTGTLMQGGKPLEELKGGYGEYVSVQVEFIRLDAGEDDQTNFQARVEEDASYVFDGGLPPGKYKVTVQHEDENENDVFKGKFSEENSTIEVDISGDEKVFDIVLD